MGASSSISTVVNNIEREVTNSIKSEAKGKNKIDCKIKLGNIRMVNSENCTVFIKNECYASTEISINIVSKAVSNVVENLNNDQKQEAAKWFTASFNISTTVNNVHNDIKEYLESRCDTETKVKNEIESGDIIIEGCKSIGVSATIALINSGSSKATCVSKIAAELQANAVAHVSNKLEQGGSFFNSLIWAGAAVMAFTAILGVITTYINKVNLTSEEQIAIEKAKKNNYSTRISQLLELKK